MDDEVKIPLSREEAYAFGGLNDHLAEVQRRAAFSDRDDTTNSVMSLGELGIMAVITMLGGSEESKEAQYQNVFTCSLPFLVGIKPEDPLGRAYIGTIAAHFGKTIEEVRSDLCLAILNHYDVSQEDFDRIAKAVKRGKNHG